MNLTPYQYAQFLERFPSANAYLIQCELENELALLERSKFRNAWQNKRLDELRLWALSREMERGE